MARRAQPRNAADPATPRARRGLVALLQAAAVAAPTALLAAVCVYTSLAMSSEMANQAQASAATGSISTVIDSLARTVAGLAVVIGAPVATAALGGLLLAGARERDAAQRRRDSEGGVLSALGRLATAGAFLTGVGLICQFMMTMVHSGWGPS